MDRLTEMQIVVKMLNLQENFVVEIELSFERKFFEEKPLF
jgi:hypothetical protein